MPGDEPQLHLGDRGAASGAAATLSRAAARPSQALEARLGQDAAFLISQAELVIIVPATAWRWPAQHALLEMATCEEGSVEVKYRSTRSRGRMPGPYERSARRSERALYEVFELEDINAGSRAPTSPS